MHTFSLLLMPLSLQAQGPETALPTLRPLDGFVENLGQWDDRVLFFGRSGGIEATVFADGFLLRPSPICDELDQPLHAPTGLFLQFASGEAAGGVVGQERGSTSHSFYFGHRHGSNARGFGYLRFEDVEPGVDVVLRQGASGFAYDVHVAAGAAFDGLALDLHGASELMLDAEGQLSFSTEAGPVHHRFGPTFATEPSNSSTRSLAPRLWIEPQAGSHRIWIDAPGRQLAESLVIDPTLEFSSYLGSDIGGETLVDLAVTPEGAKYVLLRSGAGMPTLPWSYATTGTNTWIGALSPDGANLFAATMLGGSATDQPLELHVGDDGSITAIGTTWSNDFPMTVDMSIPDGTKADIFVARLDATCTNLQWSTLFGGSNHDNAWAAALFPNGDVAIAGDTLSTEIQATSGAFDEVFDPAPTFGDGPGDRLIFRLSADGQQVVASTWFFTSEIDSLCTTPSGDLVIAGAQGDEGHVTTTAGVVFPEAIITSGTVGYVTRMHGDLSALRWSTYLSDGVNGDNAFNFVIAIDSTESIYFGSAATKNGHTTSLGAVEEAHTYGCGWVGKLLPNGTGFAWATYLAGNIQAGTQYTRAITVDEAGNASVTGTSNQPSWPVTPDAFQTEFVGPSPSGDVALTRFDAVAETLDYSTWFGGNDGDNTPTLASGADGRVVLGFTTRSDDLPTTAGAYQTAQASSSSDAVLAVFDLGLHPWRLLGPGLKGSRETPNLVGLGELTPGSPARLALRGTEPNALVFWVGGFSEVNLPLLGGTLVPFPDAVIPAQAGPTGWLDLVFPWPNLAPGTVFTVQAWCLDPAASQSFGASNGLRAIAQ
jgi:hypothetical protein